MTQKKVSFWAQVAITFFIVSGGPYGLESAVGSIGAAWTFLLVLLIPIFWALPSALMVGELSSMMPDRGGYYVWVREGLGPFWGFQEGWWTLCYSAVDLAIYPVLFITYLSYFFPAISSLFWWKFLISAVFIFFAVLSNLRGSNFVGKHKIIEMIFVSIPFFILVCIGFFKGSWALPLDSFHDFFTNKTKLPMLLMRDLLKIYVI